MDLLTFQILALVSTLLITVIGVLLPFKVRSVSPDGRWMSIGNVFSAGILFSVGLVHMLSEGSEELAEKSEEWGFPPLPFALCAAGLFLTLGIQEGMTALHAYHMGKIDERSTKLTGTPMIGARTPGAPRVAGTPRLTVADAQAVGIPIPGGVREKVASSIVGSLTPHTTLATSRDFADFVDPVRSPLLRHGGAGASYASAGVQVATSMPSTTEVAGKGIHADNEAAMMLSGGSSSKLLPYIMCVALSFHSFFEGLAVGSQTTVSNGLDILIAILAHKGMEAFALGSNMLTAGARKRLFSELATIYSVMTPLGILAGILFNQLSNDETFPAIVSCLSAGTFLFVSLIEIIPKELAEQRDKGLKFGALLFGAGLMSALAKWA